MLVLKLNDLDDDIFFCTCIGDFSFEEDDDDDDDDDGGGAFITFNEVNDRFIPKIPALAFNDDDDDVLMNECTKLILEDVIIIVDIVV